MRRAATAAALCLALAAAGCAGKDQAAYYQAQLEAIKAQKPLLVLKAQEGQEVRLSGLAELVLYLPAGGGGGPAIQPAGDPWAAVVKEGITGAAMLGGIWLGGQAAVALVDAVGRTAGHQITNSFNPAGQGGASFGTYGDGAATTNTTSDHHDTSDSYNDNSSAPAE